VIHTTLVGLEPATFRSLVRRATSSATGPTHCLHVDTAIKHPVPADRVEPSFVIFDI